jgi:hypothetical protein
VGILLLGNVLIGRKILLVQGLVELPEHLVGIDEGFKLGALDKLLFIALPGSSFGRELP